MKIRPSRIKGPLEIAAVGLEHAAKIQDLKIKNALLSAFDFGESGAADVQTGKLEFGASCSCDQPRLSRSFRTCGPMTFRCLMPLAPGRHPLQRAN